MKNKISSKGAVRSSNSTDKVRGDYMESKMQFGIVGAGLVAQNYFQAFNESKRGKLNAVSDTSAERILEAYKAVGCSGYSDYRMLAAGKDINAVIICTPPSTHEEIATYFLERGIHVLCEKPLTISVEHYDRMERMSRNHSALLSMASKFRHVADIQKARELISSGAIGEPALFENAFMADVDMSSRWNVDRAISGGGVWIDNGTHSVDIMRYLLGSVAAVRVEEGINRRGLPVEEAVHVCLRTEYGVVGSVDLSWNGSASCESFIRIFGSRGMIEIGWKQSRWRLFSENDWHVFGNGYNKLAAFVSQIDDFSDAIYGQAPLRVTWEDMRASVEVVAAGYKSLDSGRWEMVGETSPRLWSNRLVEVGVLAKSDIKDRAAIVMTQREVRKAQLGSCRI